MEMKSAIELLEAQIQNPSEGLPEELFLFITGITPMINVDLLIKDEQNRTLLTWRDDGFYPAGWHVPGGIIRYKETISERIRAVAASELSVEIEFRPEPLAINQVIHPSRRVRGHFISLLYACRLMSSPDPSLRYEKGIPRPGEWAWHDECPGNLIPVHEMYRKFI